jgi:hypothetical protein
MLLYNATVVALLGRACIISGLFGIGLWTAIVLHFVMAIWCVASLRVKPLSRQSDFEAPLGVGLDV